MTTHLTIKRLRRDEPRKLAEALWSLYEIDTSAFSTSNQYGISLLELALMQPEAFWLAELNDEYVGYISVFQFRTSRLFRELVNQAREGTLDLPDLTNNKYRRLLVSEPLSEDVEIAHIYIDAIAIKKPKAIDISLRQAMEIRKELVNAVKVDLSHLIKPSICTIAVNRGIAREIKKQNTSLKHIESTKEVCRSKDYRELFAWQGKGHRVVDGILEALSDIGIGRFELFISHDHIRSITKGGIGFEPKR